MKVFGNNTSPCSRRFKCPNLFIRKGEDIHKYTVSVNRMCNAFLFGWLKEDQFRCLVIDRGLLLPLYAEIQLKLFSLLDRNPDIMLHHLADNDNKFRSLIAHVDLDFDTGPHSTIVSDEAWRTLGSHKLDTVPSKVFGAPGDAVPPSAAMQYEAAFEE
ncbi:unnamed protein product [Hymenolepis diminuta]|uniref:Uncharacterized protein n=1 Tax=Hymenolepis diminuta TaxID=6216 RepID=A0A564Y1L0_HYMDI|nr:unnamed protein product [Hymenolepis diminuta]